MIETIESHGATYRVCGGTFYAKDTPDEVIRVLESARKSGHRIRLHHGYTTPEAAAQHPHLHGVIGRDWLEENDVEGKVGRSCGPVKIPLLIANCRSTGGPGILTDCIVKITTTGKDRRVLYQHPDYRTGTITTRGINRTFDRGKRYGKQTLTVAVLRDGEEHAAFEDGAKAGRWLAKMGLTTGAKP